MTPSIWIIGAGTFGMRAESVLSRMHPEAHIIVIDKREKVNAPHGVNSTVICAEGISFLCDNLKEEPDFPDWIIPAIPVHVAYEWVKRKLEQTSRQVIPMAVPEDLITALPNPFRGRNGELYISNADFICPPNCPEPEGICTVTGKPRPRILHQSLRELQYQHYVSIVVQSRQLAPGVGGFRPKDLYDTLETVIRSEGPILLSTACSCHGVMHAFRVSTQGNGL